MHFDAAEHRAFSARLDCHYIMYGPEAATDDTVLAVALHGFGQTAEAMLRLTGLMLGPKHAVAALQGPNQFYLAPGSNQVGYCWITHRHAESSIRLHHEMLLHVLDEAGRRFGIPPERRLLVGFSQSVGLNYRFAATHPAAIRGVIGICGGLPGNWEEGPYQKIQAALLHIARREDEVYKPEVTEHYAGRLRLRADDVEFHLLEGGHRFPSKVGPLVERWIARVF
jgi:predicted esterase